MPPSRSVDRESVKKTLLDLVSIKSFSGEEGLIADYIIDRLSSVADRVEHQPVPDCGGNVIAYFGEKAEKSMIFMTHMDTTEVFAGWTRSPWGEVDGDRVYGLGALDAKSSLAAMLEAVLEAVKRLGGTLNMSTGVMLVAVCDEEGFSRGSYEFVKSGKANRALGAVVGSPTGLRIGKGAYGRLVFDVEVRGRAATDVEEEGINAIVEAAKLVLWAVDYPKHRSSGGGSVAPISIKSKETVMVHPDLCLLRLDRHYPPGESEQSAKRKFLSYLKKLKGMRAEIKITPTKRPTPFLTPYELPDDDEFLAKFKETYGKVLGEQEAKPIVIGTVSDASYLYSYANISPVIFGPKGGNRHSPDEYVLLDSVVDMANVLVELILSQQTPQ